MPTDYRVLEPGAWRSIDKLRGIAIKNGTTQN
jgi:hypothetical protein